MTSISSYINPLYLQEQRQKKREGYIMQTKAKRFRKIKVEEK